MKNTPKKRELLFFDFTAGRDKGGTQNNKQKKEPTKSELELQEAVKGIRTVYTALVKILHPDAEAHEQKRAEKTELMKRVTLLYNDKNYFGLLKLYLMYGGNEVDSFGKTSEMRLKNYIRLLDEQLLELKQKLHTFRYGSPAAIMYYRFFKSDTSEISTYKFNKEKNRKKKTIESMKEFYLFAKDKKLFKKELKDIIAGYNFY